MPIKKQTAILIGIVVVIIAIIVGVVAWYLTLPPKAPIKPTVEKADGMVETYKVQDIAFGAKKIIARIILKERDGGTQPLEDALMALEEVQRAECSMVSIIS